jgi:hypothetical protein
MQKCPDEFQQPLVLDALGDPSRQFVVIDPIEKLIPTSLWPGQP